MPVQLRCTNCNKSMSSEHSSCVARVV